MKSIFLDTNIIIDFLGDRKPHSNYAEQIFELALENKIKIYTSSHSIATTHYILKKYIAEKELRKILLELLELLSILPIDLDTLQIGLKSTLKDFEDALQLIVASSRFNEISFIVTRNIKDFKGSTISVVTPDEFLSQHF